MSLFPFEQAHAAAHTHLVLPQWQVPLSFCITGCSHDCLRGIQDVDVKRHTQLTTDVDVQHHTQLTTDVDVQRHTQLTTDVDIQRHTQLTTDVDVQRHTQLKTDVDVQHHTQLKTDVDVQCHTQLTVDVSVTSSLARAALASQMRSQAHWQAPKFLITQQGKSDGHPLYLSKLGI